MNKPSLTGLARYNKATAAAVSQALVQLIAAFVEFPPELEQAIGIVLTSVLVWLVPNRSPEADASQKAPLGNVSSGDASSIMHLPLPALAVATALAVFLTGCASLVSGDTLADRMLGADCGPDSRIFRAHALMSGLSRAYPSLSVEEMRQSLVLMAEAAADDRSLAPAAAAFQDALIAAVTPIVLAAGTEGEPIWLSLAQLPPVAAEIVQIRARVADFCARAGFQ